MHFAAASGSIDSAVLQQVLTDVVMGTPPPMSQVLHGVTGESHAFSIAKKMGILQDVLERATELMGEQARVTKTLEALEEERGRAQVAADEAERLQRELERKLKATEDREKLLRTRVKELEKQGAEDFLRKLSELEATIGEVRLSPCKTNVANINAQVLRRILSCMCMSAHEHVSSCTHAHEIDSHEKNMM